MLFLYIFIEYLCILLQEVDRTLRRKIMQQYGTDFGLNSRLESVFLIYLRNYRSDFATEFALPEDFTKKNDENEFSS